MAQELTPADRASLSAEQGPINMAVGGVLVFEGGPGMRQDRILERIQARLHLIPRYRQRLQAPAGAGVLNPVWVDDRGFELSWHVRRAALAQSGGTPGERLSALVAQEMSRKLDRSRPLWEMTVIEGLPFGRVALMPKMHHALVDGLAAVDVGTVLLDPTPEPLDIPEPDEPWAPQPYDRRRHLARLSLTPAVQARRLLVESAQRALEANPMRAANDFRRATELLAELAKARPAAPMTPLNHTIGPNRRYAMHRTSLAPLKAAAKSCGATINDAILAAVAGMLQRYFELAGAALTRNPVALVPVSIRQAGQEGGNRISTVFVDLPIDEPGPEARMRAINAAMADIKDSAAVRAGALAAAAGGLAPPLLSAGLARAMSGMRVFNLVVSNVPGPQQAFYLNGQRLLEAYPCVPLNPATQGLNVGVLSYDGGICFGLLADRDLDPPVSVAAECLRESLGELLALAPA